MERYESINGNLIARTVEGIEPKQIGFDMQNKRSLVAWCFPYIAGAVMDKVSN